MKSNVNVEAIHSAVRGRRYRRYLVKRDGHVLGMLEKWTNSRTETHPWKAFVGIGDNIRYAGAFYGETGKLDAVALIVAETCHAAAA